MKDCRFMRRPAIRIERTRHTVQEYYNWFSTSGMRVLTSNDRKRCYGDLDTISLILKCLLKTLSVS